jgi:hypothetical protein
MASQKKWKEIAIEQSDSIALLATAIIAVILATLGKIQSELINTVLLLILCLLAFHHLRRSFKIENMHEQIREINENLSIINNNYKIHEEMGLEKIYETRKEISVKDMHSELKNASNVFIVSRYLQAFANDNAQDAIEKCLRNNGIVKIIIYSPIGRHLEVELERDFTTQTAKSKICHTIKHLRKFKEDLPDELTKNFQYKFLENHIIYTSIIGISNKIYATNYLNNLGPVFTRAQ